MSGVEKLSVDKIREIQQTYFFCGDLNKSICIKDYLKGILERVWTQNEGFCGKRPYGNSGWMYDIYAVLIENKFIDGKLDEDGYVEECNTEDADKIIIEVIQSL